MEFSLDKKEEKIICYNFLNYCIIDILSPFFGSNILLASSWFCTWNNLNQSEEPLVDASQILAGFFKSILHISRFISWIKVELGQLEIEEVRNSILLWIFARSIVLKTSPKTMLFVISTKKPRMKNEGKKLDASY